MCFSLFLVLTFAGTASARPVELTGINAFSLGNDTVRVEIAYSGGQLELGDISTNFQEGLVRVELDNTLPGRISRVSGTQIQSEARDFVEKIIANKTQERHTSIQVHLRAAVAGNVKVSLEPANRSEKKPARIVLDMKSYSSPKNETWQSDDMQYNSQRIIVLDPGHGGSDAGAIGPSGVTEKSVSLAVSLKAQRLLMKHT